MRLRRPVVRTRAARAAWVAVLAAASFVAVAETGTVMAAAEVVSLPGTGSITVLSNGNGHGHGMSQWGAQGAALQGLNATQIVGFYYPGTTLAAVSSNTMVRVLLGGAFSETTVTGATALNAPGVKHTLTVTSAFRLIPAGINAFTLQTYNSGWKPVPSFGTFSSPATFSNPGAGATLQVQQANNSSVNYRGSVTGYHSAASRYSVNTVGLDQYTQGVVPREAVPSWKPAALQAQAIAARTYALFEAQNAPAGSTYDICDTSQCQVYGGASGEVDTTNAAVSATAMKVLEASGKAIFSQFSASNGGWTVDGGQPYLPAQADPYDTAAAGDPWVDFGNTVPVAQIASYFGMSTVHEIEITQRDGHGQWGGRVLAGFVDGTKNGQSVRLAATGFDLQDAMQLPQNWFFIEPSLLDKGAGGSVVSPDPSTVDFFHRTLTHSVLAESYVTGSGWQAATDLGTPPGDGIVWDPDAASPGDGTVYLVAADLTHQLAFDSYSPSGGWAAWQVQPATLFSSPSAVSTAAGVVDVFYRGAGNTLVTAHWTASGGWSSAAAVPGITNVASGPDAMAALETPGTSKAITVTYRGTDNRIWTLSGTPGHWSKAFHIVAPGSMPTPAALDPAAGDTGTGAPAVYYTATNGVIYHSSWNVAGHAWSAWYALPNGHTTSGPDVANHGATHVDVIAGGNGQLRTDSWNSPGGWRAWAVLP